MTPRSVESFAELPINLSPPGLLSFLLPGPLSPEGQFKSVPAKHTAAGRPPG